MKLRGSLVMKDLRAEQGKKEKEKHNGQLLSR